MTNSLKSLCFFGAIALSLLFVTVKFARCLPSRHSLKSDKADYARSYRSMFQGLALSKAEWGTREVASVGGPSFGFMGRNHRAAPSHAGRCACDGGVMRVLAHLAATFLTAVILVAGFEGLLQGPSGVQTGLVSAMGGVMIWFTLGSLGGLVWYQPESKVEARAHG